MCATTHILDGELSLSVKANEELSPYSRPKSSFCRIGDVVSIASAGSHSTHFRRHAS